MRERIKIYVPPHIKDKKSYRLYHKRLNAGLCPRCGKKRDGIWFQCTTCISKSTSRRYNNKIRSEQKQRSRHNYKAKGLCVECGQPTAEGITRCEYHRQKKLEYDSRYRVNKILTAIGATI